MDYLSFLATGHSKLLGLRTSSTSTSAARSTMLRSGANAAASPLHRAPPRTTMRDRGRRRRGLTVGQDVVGEQRSWPMYDAAVGGQCRRLAASPGYSEDANARRRSRGKGIDRRESRRRCPPWSVRTNPNQQRPSGKAENSLPCRESVLGGHAVQIACARWRQGNASPYPFLHSACIA
jgi:hypothetical protein